MSRQPIKMPGLSDTMQSGHLVRWLKKPGDRVSKGDSLAEVESDKALMDVEAFDEGYLVGPLAETDRDYPVGAVLAYLDEEKPGGDSESTEYENSPTPPEKQAASAPASDKPAPEPREHPGSTTPIPPAEPGRKVETELQGQTGDHSRIRISPYARALARSLGIDPQQVAPGPGGIVKSPQVIAAALNPPRPDLEAGPPWRYKLFTPMRRAVAEHMAATVHTPSFRVVISLPLKPLQSLAHARGFSFTLLMARALARSVQAFPEFNAVYVEPGLALRDRVDVGIAVDLQGGLVTPVLRDMAGRPLQELADEWQDLKQRARQQRLKAEDYQGATIYLSNLGMFRHITHFDAIVPLGASAILALGAAREGEAQATLSADHRVVYGADAARFLQHLRQQVESPDDLI